MHRCAKMNATMCKKMQLHQIRDVLWAVPQPMAGIDVEAEITPWWLIVGSLVISGAGGALIWRSIQEQKTSDPAPGSPEGSPQLP